MRLVSHAPNLPHTLACLQIQQYQLRWPEVVQQRPHQVRVRDITRGRQRVDVLLDGDGGGATGFRHRRECVLNNAAPARVRDEHVVPEPHGVVREVRRDLHLIHELVGAQVDLEQRLARLARAPVVRPRDDPDLHTRRIRRENAVVHAAPGVDHLRRARVHVQPHQAPVRRQDQAATGRADIRRDADVVPPVAPPVVCPVRARDGIARAVREG